MQLKVVYAYEGGARSGRGRLDVKLVGDDLPSHLLAVGLWMVVLGIPVKSNWTGIQIYVIQTI